MQDEIHVWMPMIGFGREPADKGVGRLMERMSFIPKGVSAFLFHPDIVRLHAGLGEERVLLLTTVGNDLFTCNLPLVPMRMTDGRYRLYITNPEMNSCGYASVTARHPMAQVASISKCPVLPVEFMDSPDAAAGWPGQDPGGAQRTFRVKVTPGGVTILDVVVPNHFDPPFPKDPSHV